MSKCASCNQETRKCTCAKGFTPKVLEIHNPEELVLFHKVIIPSSMGDEEQTPVTIGKYCNVLMVYEANGHAYLYSSDGIPAKIAFDSGGVLFVEELPDVAQASVGFLYITAAGIAAITNDNESWVNVSGGGGAIYTAGEGIDITNNVISVDSTIATKDDVAAEAQAREQADTSLSTSVDSLSLSLSIEQGARASGDAALQAGIADERAARETADTRLQGEITDAIQTLDDEITADMATLDGKITAEATARAEADATKVDKVAGKGLSTNDFTNSDKDKLDSAIQPENIDYTVMTDLKMSTTASTTSVVMEGDKVNLKEGTPSDFEIPLPVASASQAGVINTATYQTIQDNANKINAIENGAVAITGIAAAPTQADLTTAWQTATGLTTVINGASILDVDNDKRWTFYQNTLTWYESSTGSTVTINPFTNTEAGTIKGSNVDGQVHAETDGTGSVQGWDTVKADIANNTSAIATKVDAETGKGLSTNDFTNDLKTKLEGIEAGAEANDPLYSTTGANTDGAMTQAATTNALDTKVDKVTGKQLSTNDFTDTLKTKLDSVETGAQVNRPIYTETGQNTDGSMTQKAVTDALDAKADSATTLAGYGITDAYTKTEVDTELAGKQDTLSAGGVTTTMLADQAVTSQKIDFTTMLDILHPVGSYYETSDTTFDPNIAWGGTWVEDSKGRATVAQSDSGTFATVGSTGGAETHTLTTNEMPIHHHDFEETFNSETRGKKVRVITLRHNAGNPVNAGTTEITAAGSTYNGTAWMSWRELSVGGSQAHNNLQPYVVVKRWHRTA